MNISRRDWLMAGGSMGITSLLSGNSIVWAESPTAATKDLIFRTDEPRNAEPELSKLVQSWITPTKHFYVRSHAPNPKIDIGSFQLQVSGLVHQPMSFGFDQLMKLPSHTLTATLTCAGNRRAEFNEEGQVGGVQWGAGAIGNATWSGVAMADVLNQVEVQENAKHVWFEGLDQVEHSGSVIPFGGSIPIEMAMRAGKKPALLAHQMNGAPLSADHGYPLRSLVPGYIGARSVKWLGKIIISDQPSPNHYLATAYKLVTNTDPIDWSESGPIYRYPINAAIASPAAAVQLTAGDVEVVGYVLPSGREGAKTRRVAVSADNGKTWVKAATTGKDEDFCWQLWKASVPVTRETTKLVVRATDNLGGFMPPRVPWNAKGYLQNSWFRLPVTVKG